MTELQLEALRQARSHIYELQGLFYSKPTDLSEVGKEGSHTCKMHKQLSDADKWLRLAISDPSEP
jgi:hypothetical protein